MNKRKKFVEVSEKIHQLYTVKLCNVEITSREQSVGRVLWYGGRYSSTYGFYQGVDMII